MFASARLAGVPLVPYPEARNALIKNWDAIQQTALSHSTQTNEAGRCAVLLPELSKITGPIALLEVGASAGLCLYPEKYAYRFLTEDGVHELAPAVVAREEPLLVAGDLSETFEPVIALAPEDATLVVVHSAVLAVNGNPVAIVGPHGQFFRDITIY